MLRFRIGDWVVVCRSHGVDLPKPFSVAQVWHILPGEGIYDYALAVDGDSGNVSYSCDEWLVPLDIIISETPELADLM